MVFGQGGIGSHLTFFLARTGAEIITLDDDIVEVHNIAGQLYGNQDVGKPKVKAMEDVITRLCGENKVTPIQARVEIDVEGQWNAVIKSCDVVCVSFDNIKARAIVFDYWMKHGKSGSLFVDGRMSAQNGQVFTVTKDSTEDATFYTSTLFNDAEVPEAPCTAKATTHCGSLIASLMVTQITNWFSNKREGGIPQTVVKQYDFHLPFMLFDQIK
jgi:molybdopterin/thiamine biosynthesis adenylyltransferase